MKYEKPEVVVCGSASAAIQSTGKHGTSTELDEQPTLTAYEADE